MQKKTRQFNSKFAYFHCLHILKSKANMHIKYVQTDLLKNKHTKIMNKHDENHPLLRILIIISYAHMNRHSLQIFTCK